jgi:hypothetical protein
MDTLQINWEFSSGEHCVWEIEHLFGFDVCFGHHVKDRYVPVRWVSRQTPLPEEAKLLLKRLVCQWSAENHAALIWALEEAEKP